MIGQQEKQLPLVLKISISEKATYAYRVLVGRYLACPVKITAQLGQAIYTLKLIVLGLGGVLVQGTCT